MKSLLFLVVIVCALMVRVYGASAYQISAEEVWQGCVDCHAMPPSGKSTEKRFFVGAHLSHSKTHCGKCHIYPGSVGHDNGVVDVNARLNYSRGVNISWPGGGGGACGGKKSALPIGCHDSIPDTMCLWLPGDSCKPISAP